MIAIIIKNKYKKLKISTKIYILTTNNRTI